MTVDPEIRDAVLDLLGTADDRISVDPLLDPGYWRELNPHLSLGSRTDAAELEGTPIPDETIERLRESVTTRGYLQTPPTIAPGAIDALRRAVEAIRAENLPPVFCFVYDEAWLLWSLPSLTRLVGAVLGVGQRQTSQVWCHYVPAVPGAAGWMPHSDRDAEVSGRMTLWIPLTEATLDNGCMYVVQRDMVPAGMRLEGGDAQALLRGAKALPARPGEVLGWDSQAIHWGSFCSDDPGAARVSLSMEFSAVEAPEAVALLPTFPERLNIIAAAVLGYTRFEPALLRLKDGMERLEHRTHTG